MRGGQRVLQVAFNMNTGAMLVIFLGLWTVVAEALDTCEYILNVCVYIQ
jgi:hypothetical protein